MSDRYVASTWRSRETVTGNEPTRAWRDTTDNRGQSFPAGRGRGRGAGAVRMPESDRLSRWQTASQGDSTAGGDIWSTLASSGPPNSSRPISDSRPPTSSPTIYRSTPKASEPRSDRSSLNPVFRQTVPHSTLPARPNDAEVQPRTAYAPTTPSRPAQAIQPTSLSSPSTDLQPISSSHRAFKKLDEMEMLGTLSRSGGTGDGEGDGLLDRVTQEKFLGWIEDKLEAFYIRFPSFKQGDPLDRILYPLSEADQATEKDGRESLGVILLHLRKLREGVIASRRMDSFAIKVYELSSLLSIRAGNHPQLISSLSVLVPGIYLKATSNNTVDLETKVESLSLERGVANKRAYFASLLLMYHIAHRDFAIDFWTDYFKLTRPTGKGPHRTPAFVRLEDPDIRLALSVYRAISQPSPLAYYRILRSDLTYDQKMVIGYALPRLRERTWGLMKSGWAMGMKVDFAASLLGNQTAPPTDITDGEDEWDEHLKRGPKSLPKPDDLILSLGGKMDGSKVLFR